MTLNNSLLSVYSTVHIAPTRRGVGGDLPRAWDFHRGPVYKLKNQKKKVLRNFEKSGPPIDLYLEMYI